MNDLFINFLMSNVTLEKKNCYIIIFIVLDAISLNLQNARLIIDTLPEYILTHI